jgi:hypothetical protein
MRGNGSETEKVMANLNRFPLLGLWAREAAVRLGYSDADADTIGHAYAVLYAIRANSTAKPVKYKDKEAAAAAAKALAEKTETENLEFGGDQLQVTRNAQGRLIGHVGNALPQTPETYRYKVAGKFPPGAYEKVQKAFHTFFQAYKPEQLQNRTIYHLYDQWKKSCASGRLVDLDQLIAWCSERKPTK